MSANKAKGTAWESDLVKTFAAFFGGAGLALGLEPRRVAQTGRDDSGDLHGIDPFVGQAKNYRSWEDAMRIGLDGAEKQAATAGRDYGVAFVKRARKGVGQGYAVTTVATWARLLLRLKRAEELLWEADAERYAEHMSMTHADLERPVTLPRP